MYGAKDSDILKTYTWDLEKQIRKHQELSDKVWSEMYCIYLSLELLLVIAMV